MTPPRIGRYEIQGELGRGAMGVVYEALDPALGRTVALKTIQLPPGCSEGERRRFEERFLLEARAAARLAHRGIVQVHDVGRDEDSGAVYIALERLRGRTLDEYIAAAGAMPWQRAVEVAAAVARALDHAHTRGIVHRDVKPENVMIVDTGWPKLLDFGVAKIDGAQLTGGHVFGTPRYMAPEQALGAPVDARCDVFALGCVAYLMLTGRHAFGAPSVALVLQQILHDEPPPPSLLRAGAPAALDAVILGALAKDPASRYASAGAFADDLDAVLQGRDPRLPAAAPADDLLDGLVEDVEPGAAPAAVDDPLAALLDTTSRSLRSPVSAAVAIVTSLACVAALALTLRGRAAEASAAVADTHGPTTKISSAAQLAAPPMRSGPRTDAPRPAVAPRAIELRLRHDLPEARLRAWADGTLVLDEALRGEQRRRLGIFKVTRGTAQRRLSVSPLARSLKVEVAWGDERRTTTAPLGPSRRLDLVLEGRAKKLRSSVQ